MPQMLLGEYGNTTENPLPQLSVTLLVSQARPLFFFLHWVRKKGSGDTPLANFQCSAVASFFATLSN